MRMFKEILQVVGWVALAVFVLLVWFEAARAQEHNLQDPNHFYDRDCCDTRDCVPVLKTEFKPDGTTLFYTKKFGVVTIKQSKWGELARVKKLRPSKDSGFHVCVVTFYGDHFNERGGEPEKFVRCVYAPGGG